MANNAFTTLMRKINEAQETQVPWLAIWEAHAAHQVAITITLSSLNLKMMKAMKKKSELFENHLTGIDTINKAVV